MNDITIIGFSGGQGAGKDTSSEFLKDHFTDAKVYAFASNLKELCRDVFKLSEAQLHGDKKNTPLKKPLGFSMLEVNCIIGWLRKHNSQGTSETQQDKHQELLYKNIKFASPREIMQFIGTEVLRDIYDQDYHAIYLMREIQEDAPAVALITDARFSNERARIRREGGLNIKIVGRTHADATGIAGHKSENDLGDDAEYAFVVVNDGTLEDLSAKMQDIYTQLNLRGL